MTKNAWLGLGFGALSALVIAGGPALAADAAAGADVFKKKCRTCHTVDEGKHRTGPSLFGIVGSKAGATSFKRYKGLKGVDFVWDAENLDAYIKDPKAFVLANTENKRTAMTFKLKDDTQRADVIEYLKTVK